MKRPPGQFPRVTSLLREAYERDDASIPELDAIASADVATSEPPISKMTLDQLKQHVAAEHYRTETAGLFYRMVAECGPDLAREVWLSTPPTRGRGKPVGASDHHANLNALMRDTFNRSLGMTAEQSAEDIHSRLGFSNSIEAATKRLARLRREWKRTNNPE